jgi:hypothetical protein
VTTLGEVIRAAEESAAVLARIERSVGSLDAFTAVAERSGIALAVSGLAGMARFGQRLEQAPAARMGVLDGDR